MPQLIVGERRFPATAALFDLDNTLVDCGRLWVPVTRRQLHQALTVLMEDPSARPAVEGRSDELVAEIMAALGVAPDDSLDPRGPLNLGTIGDLARISAGLLYRRGVPWDLGEPAVREALFSPVSIEEIKPAIRMLGDIPALLERLRRGGLRVALVTNNPTDLAEKALAAMGVAGQLDGVFGSDLVRVGKPAPDLGTYACSMLGVHPREAVMVGDGHSDAAMARGAGIGLVVGVAEDPEVRAALRPYVDVAIASVDELDAAA